MRVYLSLIFLMVLLTIILPAFLIVLASGLGPAAPTVKNKVTLVRGIPIDHPDTRNQSEKVWYNIGVYGLISWVVIFVLTILILKFTK